MESITWKLHFRLPLMSLLMVSLTGPRAFAQESSAVAEMSNRAAQLRPQPGDRVAVHVYGDPRLSDAWTVDEKGRVPLPRIGMIQASTMSIADLRDTIRVRWSSVLTQPTIEVSVLRRILVSGEVIRPGVYFADLPSSIGEMVAQSGGLKETAKASKMYVVQESKRSRSDQVGTY